MKQISYIQDGTSEFIKKFNYILEQSEYNLDQFIRGESIAVKNDVSEEVLKGLKDFLDTACKNYSQLEDKGKFWDEVKLLDDYEKNSKFIKWIKNYLLSCEKNWSDGKKVNELIWDDFKRLSDKCFKNFIIQRSEKIDCDDQTEIETCQIIRKLMTIFYDMIAVNAYSDDYAILCMEKNFGIETSCCRYWLSLLRIDSNQEKIWKIFMADNLKRVEKKLDSIMNALNEK